MQCSHLCVLKDFINDINFAFEFFIYKHSYATFCHIQFDRDTFVEITIRREE